MPERSDSLAPVNAEQFRELLKKAGLNVSEERAPMVLDELNVQLAFARLFPPVSADAGQTDIATFDPAFPDTDAKDDAV